MQEYDLAVEGVSKFFGSFQAVDKVDFTVEKGRFFSILGPSGCGKTTLLRMIAGFSEPDAGCIRIRNEDMRGVPPNRRPVNLVFQHLALFPMMSVAENVAFGLKRRKIPQREIKKRVNDVLERVGLPGFGDKKPKKLSGGQQQRVAIARCLVLEPAVLLLDEPLGALDVKLREQMKVELKILQAQVGTTFVYITHDQSEALAMSDHVAVMNQGRFEQIDTPQALYRAPRTAFVAGFVGNNNACSGTLLEKMGERGQVRTPGGLVISTRLAGNVAPGEAVRVFLRPEAMVIEPDETREGLSCLPVNVLNVLFDGGNSRLHVYAPDLKQEMLVALPQNNLFDHIRSGHNIKIGFDESAGICFREEAAP